ncbi:MAG: glycine oxidase ThiO [Planctomycetaceae bacterium]
MADVTIVGGGIIGLSIADELARAGATVRVLDRADLGVEASWAGAGMLPPGNLATATTAEARLRGLSDKLWPNLIAWLGAKTGVDSGYRMSGALRIFDEETGRDAELATWRSEAVPAEPVDAADLEPALGVGGPAIHLPSQSQIRNPRHLKALIASCAAQNVELIPNVPAVAWEIDGDRVTGVRTPQGIVRSDRYCVASGAWSGGLLEPIGIELPVRPIRGQIALLRAVPLPFTRIVEVGSRYLVPRPDGRILVGATEEDVGFQKRNTTVAVGDLLAMAIELCPALADATLERCWAGLRPGSPDGLPYLGRLPDFANLFVAAGHFRSGLQMSPGTARLMRQILLDQPTEFPLDEFSPCRHATVGFG